MRNIVFHDKTKTFHLYNEKISYIMCVLEKGHMGQIYFGKKIHDKEDFSYLVEKIDRPMTSYIYEWDKSFSLEHIRQEYPVYGTTDYRHPAIELLQKNGSRISEFKYTGYEITMGKPKLQGLPAIYAESEEEAVSLRIYLKDSLTGIILELLYTIFSEYGAIARSVCIKNAGKMPLHLLTAMSLNLDLPDKDYIWMQLSGAWARERHVKVRALEQGITAIDSMRGHSSHEQNPFMVLKRKNTDEVMGEAIGFSFIYSGNFRIQAEVDTHDITRITVGINPDGFDWELEPGESFQTPEAVMVYSDNGLNEMSQTFHKLYAKRLARGYWRDRSRPILNNNWEATYFDFNNEKIKEIAKESSKLGIELFVLDDGWFGERNNDDCSLGDWFVNEEKLKGGLNSLATDINKMGMQFGLWFEPEMISPKSKLYEEHPDWCIHIDGRIRSEARKQLILDLSRDEVCEAVIKMLTDVLKSAPISYVKWDMNRNMTEIGSTAWPAKKQKEIAHRYMLGLYKILENITSNFPNILFESCSGGGGRFDGGMLYYMPQTWTSDDTDAIERLMIQEGTSLVYPTSSMGSHVSAVPNHQVHRITPLNTRGVVAMAGSFGYELDVTKMNEEEKEEVKKQVEFYKNIRSTVQFGDLYRLKSSFDSNEAAWMNLSKDGKEVVVSYVKKYAEANVIPRRLKVKALDENSLYEVIETGEVFGGDELMYIGLEIGELMGDYQAKNWTLRKVD